ncbi:MAG: tyrosine-type recombinase/integrase [Patescibacteria group bacterium]
MAVRIQARHDGRLAVIFPYSEDRVGRIRTIPGRRWHPEEKAWSVPAEEGMVERLRALFAGEPVEVEERQAQKGDSAVQIIRRLSEEFRLGGYSPKTQKSYRHHCSRYLRRIGKDPMNASPDDIRMYLLYLIDEAGVSRSYYDQAVSSLKFLYEKVLKSPTQIEGVVRPRKERKLPTVLGREAVQKLLRAVTNLKHLAVLMLAYSAGLRVSEVGNTSVLQRARS